MAFDTTARNRLQKMVAACRDRLTDEFDDQLKERYGIYADEGRVLSIEKLEHLDDAERRTAELLRKRIVHLAGGDTGGKISLTEAIRRVLREEAFTILNRFAAVRMAEERGIVQESVGGGFRSKGFQVFETIAGSGLGGVYDRYRVYLGCLYDELATDLRVLFERFNPQALLFPGENALRDLFDQLNAAEIKSLWAEDETIGWIYQYYNDPDERKKMRKESAAPRNSRELAVRNQFFTPRYVVEFLTDNTLGRIWYEMTKGETRLTEQCRYLVRRPNEIFLADGKTAPEAPEQEGLSQEELLKQPVNITHRPLKDPREIRLLDPACGSMHFGLYAFDLFESIYEEAWHNGSFPALQNTYASKDEFLKDVPRLIIEHNIHGIDIDPRATQIASLSLWLRAQKAWQQQNVAVADRPLVRRSNIVCAEPMPGSPEMLENFVATLDPPPLRDLVKTVFDKMKLTGEAGSLLKIEDEIRSAINTARKELLKQQADLLTRKEGSQEEFFHTAEQQVIDALRAYAEHADADSYQRRLFADDAARGFAFIDLCRNRYDAVVMNPPFGEAAINSTASLKPYVIKNLYSCFVERAEEMTLPEGAFAAITDSTYLKQPTFVELRKLLLTAQKRLYQIIDLGWGVLDANVRTALFVCHRWNGRGFDSLDVSGRDDRGQLIREATDKHYFVERNHAKTQNLPKSVLALNLPVEATGKLIALDRVRSIAELPWGCGANDSVRLFRLRWEVDSFGIGNTWAFLTNGGEFSPLYRENYFVCRVRVENGDSAFSTRFKNNTDTLYDASAQHLYYKPGLTYPKRSRFFHLSALPSGHIFTPEGKGFFLQDFGSRFLFLAILNSSVVAQMADFLCGPHKQKGDVELIGIPDVDSATAAEASARAEQALASLQSLARAKEDSALFCTPCLIERGGGKQESLNDLLMKRETQIKVTSQIVADAFLTFDAAAEDACPWLPLDESCIDELRTAREKLCSFYSLSADCFFSYLVGCTFGRWDIRYATGERHPPDLPDPFDPLPVCPPGMLQDAAGLPAEPKDVATDYPLRISWPGILLDDENYPEDIVARVREAIKVIWKDRAEAIENEACDILGVKNLREYIGKPNKFFADHLARHSKSRRQAPLYWPLSTASGGYTIWIYYHRLTGQTLYTAVTDFVEPKITDIDGDLARLRSAGEPDAKVRAEIEALADLRNELVEFREELLRVAQLPYRPNLNDGVLITAAPLWKLFRLPKWRNALHDCWKKLKKGDYDWARLTLSIWPARVREKCKTDKSLAIAHGLEELFEEATSAKR